MPAEYDSRDDSRYDSRDDSRYDSRDDSRYDSRDDSRYDSAPPPPPKKVGYGIAGILIACGGMGVALILGAATLFFGTLLRPQQGDVNGMGLACSLFILVILFVLSACALAMSLTGAGLGVGGIAAGHGRGRRLGIYAVCFALIPITTVVAIIAWIFNNWN